MRDSESLPIFKNKLKLYYKPADVPSYFRIGERSLSVLHSRLRNGCSNLNGDLFRNHLTQDPQCICGHDYEDADHFLFNCNRFTNQRTQLFRSTRQNHPLSANTLLFGNENFSDDQNRHIFLEVQNYIAKTERFKETR